MSMAAGPQQSTEHISFDVAPVKASKRATGSTAWVLAALLLVVATGLGYVAFTLRDEQQSARATLETKSRELSALQAQATEKDAQIRALEAQAADQVARLAEGKAKVDELSAELAAAHTRLDELDAQRGEIIDQLAEFKQMTRELQRMIDTGRLKVTFRRGRMIVELPAQVLFPSGSADLTPEGREALTQVAKSLRGFKSRNFIVAGHTDNVPVGGGKFASNWELSSARAVNVTDALMRGGLKPEQLVAAGYSEYDPVARNSTEAGKQSNRRIEIILEPRLRELAAKPQPGKAAEAKKATSKPTLAKKSTRSAG